MAKQVNIPEEISVSLLSNEEVLRLTELQMSSVEDERLSELLYIQREHTLSKMESLELEALMEIYKIGLLRKSEGLAEAVKRGLLTPLEP